MNLPTGRQAQRNHEEHNVLIIIETFLCLLCVPGVLGVTYYFSNGLFFIPLKTPAVFLYHDKEIMFYPLFQTDLRL